MTILNVCGFVVFFAVAESTIPEFFAHPFINGLLEITGGINDISKLSMDLSLIHIYRQVIDNAEPLMCRRISDLIFKIITELS